MSVESTLKMSNDSEVAKSAKRNEVVQTQSKFKASVSTIEKRIKVTDATLVSEPKNVAEDASGSEPNNDTVDKPPEAVQLKPHLPHCKVQSQILRCFIMRELNATTEDAFLVDINDSKLRFTIKEFAIVFGLKCIGDFDDFQVAPKRKTG
ncbi:hypothetical protein K7X08_033310 [Anisodus acutangulus]|uniref:Uncharacterized protein n=1 Tax=Anisodus acutangulus TaxID=402998 RepID=A0A9Q1RCG0_9SOLA|nr:hypothetical protein K7X08_033310 [Anisodus acutangulus]